METRQFGLAGPLAAGALTLMLASPGFARPIPVRLLFAAERGERCLSASALSDLVVARLGSSPFEPTSPAMLRVRVKREDARWCAAVTLTSPGRSPLHKELSAPSGRCSDLARLLALTIAVALDPIGAFGKGDPPPVALPVGQAPQHGPTPAEMVPARPISSAVAGLAGSEPKAGPPSATLGTSRRRPNETLRAARVSAPAPAPGAPPLRFAVFAEAVGSLGAEPAPTAGLAAGLELRRAELELALGGRADLPASREVLGGSVAGSIVEAELAACWRPGRLGACGLVDGGMLRLNGVSLPGARGATTPWVAAGARLFALVRLAPSIDARGRLDVAAPLARTTAVAGDDAVWSTPAVAVDLGLGLVWSP